MRINFLSIVLSVNLFAFGAQAQSLTTQTILSASIMDATLVQNGTSSKYSLIRTLRGYFNLKGYPFAQIGVLRMNSGNGSGFITFVDHDIRYQNLSTIENFVTNCPDVGGVNEVIVIPGIGSVNTCKMTNAFMGPNDIVSSWPNLDSFSPPVTGDLVQSNTIWIGAVPGGEVKAIWKFKNNKLLSYILSEVK